MLQYYFHVCMFRQNVVRIDRLSQSQVERKFNFCRRRFRGQRLAITQGIVNTVARGSLQCFCLVFLWLHISVLVSFLCVLRIQETALSQLGRGTKQIWPNLLNFRQISPFFLGILPKCSIFLKDLILAAK